MCKYITIITLLFIFKIGHGQDIVSNKIKTIVIDAGHGGKDPGAIGSTSREKDISLAVALKLGHLISLQNPDVKIIYTRVDDHFVELYQRANIANKAKADLFISLHLNSNKKKEPNGSEFYVLGLHRAEENLDVAKKENSVVNYEGNVTQNYGFDPNSAEGNIIMTMKQSLFLDKSIQFAKACEKEFGKTETQLVRGTRQAGFVVLYQSSMPSCLVEIGFISNPAEEAFLNSSEGQMEIAQKLANAFKEFKFNYEDNSKKDPKESSNKKTSKLSADNAAQTPANAIVPKTEQTAEKIESKKPANEIYSEKTEIKQTISEEVLAEKKETKSPSIDTIVEKKETIVPQVNPVSSMGEPEKPTKTNRIEVDDAEDIYSYRPSKNSLDNSENVVLYNKYSAIETPVASKEINTEVVQPKKTPLFIEEKKESKSSETSSQIDVMKYPKDVPTLYKETVVEKRQQEATKAALSNTTNNKTTPETKKIDPVKKAEPSKKDEPVFKIQVKASKGKLNNIDPTATLGKLEESFEDGLYKYLLGSFKTKEEARTLLDKVKASGIVDAFIVKYKNGERVPLNVN